MSDPISSYRNVVRNADLMVGGDPARECGRAAMSMVEGALDGLRQGRMDEAGARRVLAEGQAALGRAPVDLQGPLAAKLSELDVATGELARARTGRTDHVAPTAQPAARATSPAATLNAGIRPQLAALGGDSMRAQLQQSLFADRGQTTRTLGALASMSPRALSDLVTARVGAFHAPAVLEALGDVAQMQMRVRVSDRAHTTLIRGAQRLEDSSTGDGLQAALNRLRGPDAGPVVSTLVALGVDADHLASLLERQTQPPEGVTAARHELALLVSDTMRGGVEQMRELAQRYDAAHNVLDSHGALYQLFPESVRQVSAQLGVPTDASRSALGSFVQQDVADAASAASRDQWIAVAATLLSAVATGGLAIGIAGGLGSGVLRSAGSVGLAYQHADEMATSAAAGEADAEAAADARTDAHVTLGLAAGATLVGIGVGHGAHAGMHALHRPIADATAGMIEGGVEVLADVAGHQALLGH